MKVTSDIAAAEAMLLASVEENTMFDIIGYIKNNIHMNISLDELRGDIDRFIRHEAMRAGLSQEEILKIIESVVLYGIP